MKLPGRMVRNEPVFRFFSAFAGSEQRLKNGNTVIVVSADERIFEVTPQGETVWEFVPAYKPLRPKRYPYDWCPQLQALGAPVETPVDLRNAMPAPVGKAAE